LVLPVVGFSQVCQLGYFRKELYHYAWPVPVPGTCLVLLEYATERVPTLGATWKLGYKGKIMK